MLDRSDCVDVLRIRTFIRQSGLDAVLVTSPEALPSLSAFYHWDVAALPEFPHFVLWPATDEPCFISPSRRGQGRRSPIISDHRTYVHDVQRKGNEEWRTTQISPIQQVAEAIRDRGLSAGRIGVEMRQFPLGYARELQQYLPEIRLDDCERLLDRIRSKKTATEIAHLRRAAYATDRAVSLGLLLSQPGDSEKTVSDRISTLLLKYGATSVSHSVICSGDRCKVPHQAGSETAILRPGDLVATDFGGVFQGYVTDIARMAVVGKPTPRQAAWYSRMGNALMAAVDRVKPGLPVRDLARTIVDQLDAVGMSTKYEMLGHSIGIGVHDWPMVTPYSEAIIEQDMIMALEFMTEDPETGDRFEIEDIILVTATAAERLTSFSVPAELLHIE